MKNKAWVESEFFKDKNVDDFFLSKLLDSNWILEKESVFKHQDPGMWALFKIGGDILDKCVPFLDTNYHMHDPYTKDINNPNLAFSYIKYHFADFRAVNAKGHIYLPAKLVKAYHPGFRPNGFDSLCLMVTRLVYLLNKKNC